MPLSERAERLTSVWVNNQPYQIERIWRHEDRLIFKFAGVDSISDAEKLAGCDVTIPGEERPPAPEDEYYHSDLIGCRVVELGSGRVLGEVEDWQEYGGPPLLQVKTQGGREILIPFAKAICREIDVAGRRIGVELPEGLDDL